MICVGRLRTLKLEISQVNLLDLAKKATDRVQNACQSHPRMRFQKSRSISRDGKKAKIVSAVQTPEVWVKWWILICTTVSSLILQFQIFLESSAPKQALSDMTYPSNWFKTIIKIYSRTTWKSLLKSGKVILMTLSFGSVLRVKIVRRSFRKGSSSKAKR